MNKPQQQESCKRCGKKYKIEGVFICPCIDLTKDGGYIQFSTSEDAQKALALIATERLREVIKDRLRLPVDDVGELEDELLSALKEMEEKTL